MATEITKGEAVAKIGEEGGSEAVSLVVNLMERSQREIDWAMDCTIKGLERERDEWRERALEAENRLFAAQNRVLALFDME